MTDTPARTYGVELLDHTVPTIDKQKLVESLRRWCPSVTPLDSQSDLLAFAHPDHSIELLDARIPAQTFVAVADKPFSPSIVSDAVAQTWQFGRAEETVDRCASAVLVTDLMSSGLEYRARLDLFQRVLRGVLEIVPCAAVHWRLSQRIVDPAAWKEAFDAGDAASLFFAGAVNVRLFDIEGPGRAPGETVMDTMGLGALGLPDIQCHFVDIEPSAVARTLYNTAWYLFEKGDVVEDGNTVEGATPGSKWRCRHETSLVGPERVVVDLDPGAPHGASGRTD